MSETLEDTAVHRVTRQNGPAIAEIRKLSGWSQNKFAAYIGISQPALSEIESEKNNAEEPTIASIARGLSIPVAAIRNRVAPCAACAARAPASTKTATAA